MRILLKPFSSALVQFKIDFKKFVHTLLIAFVRYYKIDNNIMLLIFCQLSSDIFEIPAYAHFPLA